MPLSVLLVLVYGQILSTAPTEQRIVHLAHVLEEPLDVAPLPAQLALLPHLAGLDPAGVVQLHVDHLGLVRRIVTHLTEKYKLYACLIVCLFAF